MQVWKLWNEHFKILFIEDFSMIPRIDLDIPKIFHFNFTEFSMSKLINV